MLPPRPRMPETLQMLAFAVAPLRWLDDCHRRHGDVFTLTLPRLGRFVMLADPAHIKQVFTGSPDALHAGKANRLLEPIVGARSLLLLDGQEHLRMRRLLLPPFHGERMQAYARIMSDVAEAALDRMPVGEAFAIQDHFQAITLEVILRAVFGLDAGQKMERLSRLLVEFLEPPPSFMVFMPPAWLDFPLSPYRTLLRRRERVWAELAQVVAARRSDGGAGERDDVLSLLLAARDEEGRGLTDEELRDELLTLLLAGHETTATTLAWVLERLLDDERVMERLVAEVATARAPDGTVDPTQLAKLEYLDAVVKETLRVRPILPDVVRNVREPITVGGYDIPVGWNVAPCVYLAQKREATWPDAAAFRPERFVGTRTDPYAWLPFGGGVRRCLGMAFAMYEMKVVVGTVLGRARFRRATPRPLAVVRRGITLGPEGGTRVTLVERRPRRARAVA